MNTIYKKSIYSALSILVCVFLALPSSAQRTSSNSNSGGGGGGRSSGGGGGGSSAPSARPSGGFSGGGARSSGGGNVGVSRPPSGAFQRNTAAPNGYQRGGSAGVGAFQRNTGAVNGSRVFVDRRGNVMNNYAPRTGVVGPRNGVVVPNSPRVNVSGGVGSYRTSPQFGNARGSGYWGNHNYYHYNRGYYGSYYAPRLGFTIGALPYGYYPFYFGDYQYYYSDGLFYQYENDQYTVVEPPVGAEVTSLPSGAQSIVINGSQYYESNGVYYQPYTKDDGTVVYQVAGKDGQLNTTDQQVQDQPQGPQMGDIVPQLPEGSKKIRVNGTKLFVSLDGVYYQAVKDQNGSVVFKIVGLPTDEPDQGQQ